MTLNSWSFSFRLHSAGITACTSKSWWNNIMVTTFLLPCNRILDLRYSGRRILFWLSVQLVQQPWWGKYGQDWLLPRVVGNCLLTSQRLKKEKSCTHLAFSSLFSHFLSQDLTVYPRIALNSGQSYRSLLSADVTGIRCHSWLHFFILVSPGT